MLARLVKDADDDPGASARRRLSRVARAATDRAARVEAALGALGELKAKRAVAKLRNPKQTGRQDEPRASTSDPDARVMENGGRRLPAGL